MIKQFVLLTLLFLVLMFSCISSSSVQMPVWVNDVYSVYNRAHYIAATGFGSDRNAAEKNALAALTAFFGQTVQVDRMAASSYQQAVINGVMDGWIDTAEMRTNIRSFASMDNLIGVEIKEVWFDSKGTYYAVAAAEKNSIIRIYNELINANNNIINNLTDMTSGEKNSMEGVIRYRFAATVADINSSYRDIVVLLGGSISDSRSFDGDYYRLEAKNIIKTIPISIKILNDRNGRISSAFAKCFTDWGFETISIPVSSASMTRYSLEVNVSLNPVVLPGNPNIFSRIELIAALSDNTHNRVLIPYSFISREGSISQTEADNRCITAAERDINEVFSVFLSDYLSQLLPNS
ncbi:MAG: LPP20 family lipoprotein [Treponema sp.]|nr:LPP20 family lipoprotein [Treponema sp.]